MAEWCKYVVLNEDWLDRNRVEDVVLSIRLPERKRARNVSTFVPGASKRRYLDGVFEIKFPRLEAYQAVHLELE
jgi:hypothetical protein